MAELEEYLDAQHAGVSPERFEIRDAGQADWALRKIAKARSDRARAEAFAHEERAKIDAWLEGEVRRHERTIEFFQGLLAKWHRPQYEADPKGRKTIKLPNGQLQWHQPPVKFERDDGQLVQWLEERGLDDLVERRARPRWSELKRRLGAQPPYVIDQETGEVVGGVIAAMEPEEFRVKT